MRAIVYDYISATGGTDASDGVRLHLSPGTALMRTVVYDYTSTPGAGLMRAIGCDYISDRGLC